MHGLVVFLGRHVILNTQQATDHRNASQKRVTSGFHVWCVMLPFRGPFQHARVAIRDKPLAEPPLFYALWYSRFTAGSVFEGFCTQQFGDSSDSNSKEISWFMRLIIQNDGWTWSFAVHFATSWCHPSWQPIQAVSFFWVAWKYSLNEYCARWMWQQQANFQTFLDKDLSSLVALEVENGGVFGIQRTVCA